MRNAVIKSARFVLIIAAILFAPKIIMTVGSVIFNLIKMLFYFIFTSLSLTLSLAIRVFVIVAIAYAIKLFLGTLKKK